MKILKFLIFFLFFVTANGEKMQNLNEIYLAGGCFWGMQGYFDKVEGINKIPAAFILEIFSLKAKIPTKTLKIITPMFIAINTRDGFWLKF